MLPTVQILLQSLCIWIFWIPCDVHSSDFGWNEMDIFGVLFIFSDKDQNLFSKWKNKEQWILCRHVIYALFYACFHAATLKD